MTQDNKKRSGDVRKGSRIRPDLQSASDLGARGVRDLGHYDDLLKGKNRSKNLEFQFLAHARG